MQMFGQGSGNLRHEVTQERSGFPEEVAVTLGEGHLMRVMVLEEPALATPAQRGSLSFLLPPVSCECFLLAIPARNWKAREPSSPGPQWSASGSRAGWERRDRVWAGEDAKYAVYLADS